MCLISLSGCGSLNMPWNPFYKPADIAQPLDKIQQDVKVAAESNPFVTSGRMIDGQKLKKGGVLLLRPFRAGPKVESNARLDKLSLKMVQGLADALKDYRPYFTIITDEGKQTADFVVKGFFTEVGSENTLKNWLPGLDDKELKVDGQILDRSTGKAIAIFSDGLFIKDNSKDYLTMSYEIGRDIGQFIRTSIPE